MSNYKQVLGYRFLEDIDEEYLNVALKFFEKYDVVGLINIMNDDTVDLTYIEVAHLKYWLNLIGSVEDQVGEDNPMISFSKALAFSTERYQGRIPPLAQIIFDLDHPKSDEHYLQMVQEFTKPIRALNQMIRMDQQL